MKWNSIDSLQLTNVVLCGSFMLLYADPPVDGWCDFGILVQKSKVQPFEWKISSTFQPTHIDYCGWSDGTSGMCAIVTQMNSAPCTARGKIRQFQFLMEKNVFDVYVNAVQLLSNHAHAQLKHAKVEINFLARKKQISHEAHSLSKCDRRSCVRNYTSCNLVDIVCSFARFQFSFNSK